MRTSARSLPGLALLLCAFSAQTPPRALKARLCSHRRGCAIQAPQDAGEDAAGRRIQVVQVALKPHNAEDCQGHPSEYWALAWRGEALDAVQHLVDLCPGSYGTIGGDDEITVGPNRFSDARFGGSTERGTRTMTVQLFPPQHIEELRDTARSTAPETQTTQHWSYTDHAGTFSTTMPLCNQDDSALETTGVLIPATDLPKGASWENTTLGACAATVDSATGPVVYGEPGEAGDAILRVAQVGESLWIEVQDDHLVPTATPPVNADHVELWLSGVGGPDCMDRATVQVTQWLIALDGTVSPGLHAAGAPPPTVQVAVKDGRVRMRVTPPENYGYSVIWSDSDDGRDQERLIGTSSVQFGDPRSMGMAWTAACEVREGALQFVAERAPDPDAALMGL